MQTSLLLIDDDAAVRESLQKVLQEAGYQVYAVATGQTGLGLLETQPCDLLLLDLHLPDRSGWDIFECVISHYPLLPVVLITGLGGQHETAAAAAAGALLEKPLDAPVLLRTIERLLCEPSEARLRRLYLYAEQTRQIPAVGAGYLDRMHKYPISHFDRIRQFSPRTNVSGSPGRWRNLDQRP